MAGEKLHVLWSPNIKNEFATYGSELRVYTALPTDDTSDITVASDIHLSNRHVGRLIAASSEVECQTVAWQPSKNHTHCFAVGQSNGKVSLINLLSKEPTINLHALQLTPKTLGRSCNCVVWNPSDNRLLAEGLEKTRSDSSLIVWDVTRASGSAHDKTRNVLGSRIGLADTTSPSEDRSKFFEAGHGENTSAIAWIPSQENSLVAGMGSRYLKIFDIREEHATMQTSGPREYAQHKAIYGITVDPYIPHQLTSYAEGSTIYIWDTRAFQRPLYSFQRHGNIVNLSWLTTRPGCLSVLVTEFPYLRLINIPFVSQTSDSVDTYIEYLGCHSNDRCPLSYSDKIPLTGIQWHTEWQNTALTVNREGVVKEIIVWDKTPISWSGRDSIVSASSNITVFSRIQALETSPDDDISVVMRRRVGTAYGFNASKNVEVIADVPALHSVWTWLLKQQTSDSKRTIQGVSDALEDISGSTQTTPPSPAPPFPTFSSIQRMNALDLCGWSFSNDKETMNGFLKREELSERFERAAAIAVFQGDLPQANSSLREGAMSAAKKGDTLRGSLLNLIALSLSGYSPSEPSLWQETCLQIRRQISHPYLRVMFNFLCAINLGEGFHDILSDNEVMLQDRVAFACRYLDDQKLKDYISKLKEKVVTQGLIEGLFLTGLNEDGISLLANYVNKSGDVQTACFIAGQVLPIVNRNENVKAWFEGYRGLLDQWQMWKQRAQFDHQRKIFDPSYKPIRQAAVLCTFCYKAISSDILRQERLKAPAKKSTSCPSCRKPLPRCALCLLHMEAGNNKGKDYRQSDQFGQWFTWCQTCRHGGHANHIAEWFEKHSICPVTDCTCRCLSLDSSPFR